MKIDFIKIRNAIVGISIGIVAAWMLLLFIEGAIYVFGG